MPAAEIRHAVQAGLAGLACLVAAATVATPAMAVENPTEWVRSIYAKYAANQFPGNALDLFKPEATPRLKARIDAEAACIKRTKAICGLDFDPIANAQDFEIKNVAVTSHAKVSTTQPNQGWVTATFTNGGPKQTIEYYFIQQGGRWLLDEVTAKGAKSDEWVLSKLLGKPS